MSAILFKDSHRIYVFAKGSGSRYIYRSISMIVSIWLR